MMMKAGCIGAVLLGLWLSWSSAWAYEIKLLHVSYLSTREVFEDINRAFADHYRRKTGNTVRIEMNHAAADHQLQYIREGVLDADVVTMPSSADIDELVSAQPGLVDRQWRVQFANQGSPFATAIALMVRNGNPRGIYDWDDILAKPVEMVASNPRTSGFARYRYFVIYVHAYQLYDGDMNSIIKYMTDINKKITIMAPTVAESKDMFFGGLGDVLPIWENEGMTHLSMGGQGAYELVYPDVNVLCQPRIAVVSANAEKHHTLAAAREYINFIYSEEGQEIIARHGLRPYRPSVWKKYRASFPKLRLVDMSKHGDIVEFRQNHFSPGGIYDEHMADYHIADSM